MSVAKTPCSVTDDTTTTTSSPCVRGDRQRFFSTMRGTEFKKLEKQFFLPLDKKFTTDHLTQQACHRLFGNCDYNCFSRESRDAADLYFEEYMVFETQIISLIDSLPCLPARRNVKFVHPESGIQIEFTDFIGRERFIFTGCRHGRKSATYTGDMVIAVGEQIRKNRLYYYLSCSYMTLPQIKLALWVFTWIYENPQDPLVVAYRESLGNPADFLMFKFAQPCTAPLDNHKDSVVLTQPWLPVVLQTNTTVVPTTKKRSLEIADQQQESVNTKAKTDQQKLESPAMCIICESSPASTTVLPCLHKVLCQSCSNKLTSGNEAGPFNKTHCIYCRVQLEAVVSETGDIQLFQK